MAGVTTPDYFNTCGFMGADGTTIPLVPLPIPSGEGAVGIGAWYESVGTCINGTLLTGESYDISFYVGFNSSDEYPSPLNLELTLFGTNDCSNLSPTPNPFLCFDIEFFEIAIFDIVGVENDSWIFFSSSFILDESYSAIILGHSCDFIETNGLSNYHFLDNIQISGNIGTLLSEIPELSYSGNCIDGVFLETNITNADSYQWFLDGVLFAETSSNSIQIDVASQSGMFSASVLDVNGCTLYSESIFIQIQTDVLDVESTITEVSCAIGSDGIIELLIDSPNLPYYIIWSDGSTSSINDNLAVGTYTVTVTDNFGCFTSETYILEEPEKINATLSGDCINGIFISIDEVPGVSYQWYINGILISDAIQNPYEIPSDASGIYHVVATFGVSCTESNPLDVDIDLEILDINGEVVNLLCFGLPTGSIDLVDNAMNPPLTYIWSNGEDTQEITDLDAGTYTVTVIDANGCFGEMDFTVVTPSPFINTLAVVQPDMGNPGSAGINSVGGTMPYTYTWNDGFDQSTNNNLAAGSYSITVTDRNGCNEVFEFEIISNFVVIEMFEDESCLDACDGSILLTIDGANSDYTVMWDDINISGFNPTEVCSGTYSYTVTDSDESPFVGTVTISSSPEIIISATYEDTICANGLGIDIVLSVSGGNTPYSYLWNTGSTNDTLFGVGPGIYSVEVINFLGCSVSDTFIIDSFPLIELQFETTPTGCNGAENGTIDLTVINGSEPFSFLWYNNSISEDLIDIGAGWYAVLVTDSNGCMAIDSIRVFATSSIEVINTINHVNCKGDNDGSILLEILGGEMPYDITWSNDEKTANIDSLPPGFYDVTIIDKAGCTWSQNYEVLLNSDLDIIATIEDNECQGGEEGSIELTISNANSTYSIMWADGSTDENRYDLSAGDYSFVLIDSFGCEYMEDYIISEGIEITYQSIISEPGCNGATDGIISISPVTGAFPFSYQWSNGDTINQIDDLPSDTYFLTITDDNGCLKQDTFLLSENSDVVVTETVMNNLCYGENEGSISLDIVGGSQPYDILWSNGGDTDLIANLPAGDYFVTIEDGIGCSSNYIYILFEPDSLQIEDFVELPLCHDDLGRIGAQGNGGTQPYTFLWSTGETAQIINIEPGNTYMVTMTDMNQCAKSKTYIIEDITEIDMVTTLVIDPSSLFDDGSITIDITGGTQPYTITWDDGQTGLSATDLGAGFYTATVVDANGCTQTLTVELTNDLLSAIGVATDNLCFGDCEGQITLTIEGGAEPYTITWANGQQGLNATSLCNGEYQATIIDEVGEEFVSDMFIITSPSTIIIQGIAYDISCVNMEDGAIVINSDGGEAPFGYNWSNAMIGDSIGNLGAGEYSVTVMDSNGCSESDTYTINDIPLIDIDLEPLPLDCENPNGTIIINSDNPYDYPYLINGIQVVPNEQNEIDNLASGTYLLSYAINTTCLIDVESFIIEEQISHDFELSGIEFSTYKGEEIVITLNLNQDSLMSISSVDWNVINSFDCIEFNQNGQCIAVTILAEDSEIIEVVITDIKGCETILKAKIIVEDREKEVYIPNIFSPNDDGINDEFTIFSNNEDLVIRSIQIFDRWGSMVHNQRNIDLQNYISWNGELNGKKVTPNVYVYMIEVVDG